MDDTLHHLDAPLGWLQALDESDDDLAAGRTVPGQMVRQGLLDSIARIDAKQASRQRATAKAR